MVFNLSNDFMGCINVQPFCAAYKPYAADPNGESNDYNQATATMYEGLQRNRPIESCCAFFEKE